MTRKSHPTLAFARPSKSATIIAAITPSTVTPGKTYAPIPTAIAVITTLIRNPMMRVIVRYKKLLYPAKAILQGKVGFACITNNIYCSCIREFGGYSEGSLTSNLHTND